jgi:hypothetical protein
MSWRWTPTLALLGGSLLYVAVAIAVVPSEIDFSGNPSQADASALGAQNAAPPAEAPAAEEAPPAAPVAKRARRRRLPAPTPAAETAPAEALPEAPQAAPGTPEAPPAEMFRRGPNGLEPVQPSGEVVAPFDPNSVPPAEP